MVQEELREVYGIPGLEARERDHKNITMEGEVAKSLTLRLVGFHEQTVLEVIGYHGKEDSNYRLQVKHNRETLWV